MTPEYKSFFEMMSMRFCRGFLAGVMGSMTMLLSAGASSLEDMVSNPRVWLFTIISGAMTGGLMAVDKWIRSDGTDYKS